tara:strand:+ start:15100 stop:16344 length:1245 start_codon:yes stop_codon:yes gene_type:complete
MSNLLERAIIDAKALKEAALKNAEQLVIERYSSEVKSAMNRLLEAPDDDPFTLEDPMMDAGGEEEDPFADDALGLDDPFAAADDTLDDPASQDEFAQEDDPNEESGIFGADSFMTDIPDGFAADDDEIISIKLDSLDAEFEDEEGVFGGDDELEDDEIGIDLEDESDFEDEDMSADDDFGIDISPDVTPDMQASPEAAPEVTADMVAEVLQDLGVEEEIDLEEVMEAVRVDFEPQKSGWAGTPESLMREYESMLIAREQDSKVKEENEELRKNVAALQKENKNLASAAIKLQEQNKKYNSTFQTLQEKLETMNVSNAKLLYINQALENASLNERQKRKIVEAISKAETVQEAKIVFETLNETVATNSDVKREATLSEVVSRKSSLLVAARNEQPNKEANPLFNRMQTLAGIKTK